MLSKQELLGMPWGTANTRLHRMILFQQAQRLGDDCCFRCGGLIETLEELSIEHKRRYREDAALFWDLDNIAFSHRTCNYSHGRQFNGSDQHGPDGRFMKASAGGPTPGRDMVGPTTNDKGKDMSTNGQ